MTAALVLVGVLVAVAAAAVAVAVRAASRVASRERLAAMAAAGVAGAPAAVRSLDEPDRSAGVAQVAVPFAAVLTGWGVVAGLRVVTHEWLLVLSVAALVAVLCLLTVCVESVPRAAALAAPERTLARFAWVHRALGIVAYPVAAIAGRFAAALLLPVGMWLDGGRGRVHTVDELAELAGGIGEGGTVERSGGGLLASALGFLDVRVRDVMAHRDRLVTVPRDSTVERAEQLVHSSGHSRVLVLGEQGDVTGFLHAKDLIDLAPDQRDGLLPAGLVRVALRVEPDDRLGDVLPRMRRARRHVAVVEDGDDVLGLVTLEDVLEAIVGDIRDESDHEADEGDHEADEGAAGEVGTTAHEEGRS